MSKQAPSKKRGPKEVRYAVLPSPIGPLFAAFGGRGVVRLEFGRGVSEAAFRRSLPAARRVDGRTDPAARELRGEIERYFGGGLGRFTARLDLRRGTPFQRRVWAALGRIPLGKTLSYGELARRVGAPGAARAVGQAVGANPLPILIPCHRVIAASGKLGGFSAGVEIKRWLLGHEAQNTPHRREEE